VNVKVDQAAKQRARALQSTMNKLRLFWDSIRSNKYFVAFEGGATGALTNYLQDLFATGHKLDFSKGGLQKLGFFMLSGGYTAVRLLYRPPPVPTVVATAPPSYDVKDVPAILTPQNPQAVPVSQEATTGEKK
jgi:hypothetical protein